MDEELNAMTVSGSEQGQRSGRFLGSLKDALVAGKVPGLTAPTVRPEVQYGANSRIYFLLSGDGPDTYVEVKSVTLCREHQPEDDRHRDVEHRPAGGLVATGLPRGRGAGR